MAVLCTRLIRVCHNVCLLTGDHSNVDETVVTFSAVVTTVNQRIYILYLMQLHTVLKIQTSRFLIETAGRIYHVKE